VRLATASSCFPGGVGTAEEIRYLLGVLLDPTNAGQPLKVVLTGPKNSADYFVQIKAFIAIPSAKKPPVCCT
jgi:predicted Rossmann-fold nucleotide-binding protein